jgi:hypothetical protein
MSLENLNLVELNAQEVHEIEGGNIIWTVFKEAAKTLAADAVLDLAKSAASAAMQATIDHLNAHPDVRYGTVTGKI